jgi:hypothetical protein
MKINSRPPNFNPASSGADKPNAAQPGKSFELQGKSAAGRALQAVGSQFKASDLDAPVSADKAVRASFAAMLEDQPVSGALPGEKREALADFMASDPILHQKMLTYLRKTLS